MVIRIVPSGRGRQRAIGHWAIDNKMHPTRVTVATAARLGVKIETVRLPAATSPTVAAAANLVAAACAVVRRCDLRLSRPDGSTDRGGRWYPNKAEENGCCNSIRTPSRAWPWSLYRHCCSAKHVAWGFGLGVADVGPIRRAILQ